RITPPSLAAAAHPVIYFPTSCRARRRITAGRFVVLVEIFTGHLAVRHARELKQEIDNLFLEDWRAPRASLLRILPIVVPNPLLLARELARTVHNGAAEFIFRHCDVVLLSDFGKHQAEPYAALRDRFVFSLGLLLSRVFVGERLSLSLELLQHRLPHAIELLLNQSRRAIEFVHLVEFVEQRALDLLARHRRVLARDAIFNGVAQFLE